MNLQEILSKIANGEELSDEERQFLSKTKVYTQAEVDEVGNSRATAAKKKAESERDKAIEERDQLQERVTGLEDTHKNADQKLQDENKRLTTQVENLEKSVGEYKEMEASRARSDKISSLREKAGFLSKDEQGNSLVSDAVLTAIVDNAFQQVETDDLDREAVTDPVLRQIREDNPHLIDADGGFGTGTRPPKRPSRFAGKNPWKTETLNLTEQGKILRSDPQLAQRLKAEAGVVE